MNIILFLTKYFLTDILLPLPKICNKTAQGYLFLTATKRYLFEKKWLILLILGKIYYLLIIDL